MSAQPGFQAVIQIGAVLATIGNLKTAELSVNGDIYDITSLGNQWKQKLGGLADYTIKLAGNWDMSDAQQQTLQADLILNPGTVIPWAVFPTGTGSGNKKYSGSMILKTMGVKIDVKSEQQVTFDAEGTGPILYG